MILVDDQRERERVVNLKWGIFFCILRFLTVGRRN